MKLRTGFVSNSSSSSFVVRNKENIKKFEEIFNNHQIYCGDYYEFNGVLYTSPISDGLDEFNYIYDLADESIPMAFSGPYDEEDYVEVEGVLGVSSVYIPMSATNKQNIIDEVGKQLYTYILDVQRNFDVHNCKQVFDNNGLNEDAIYIVEKCLDLIRYGRIEWRLDEN